MIDEVLRRADALGIDVTQFVVGRSEEVAPVAPSHRWVIYPSRLGGVVIGGMDRGEFATHAHATNVAEAVHAVRRLTESIDLQTLGQQRRAASVAAQEFQRHLLERATTERVVKLPIGTPLDHIGNESGHCLYFLDTAFTRRSLPPTDLNEPRTGYLVSRDLEGEFAIEVAQPWFGQSGGAVIVRLRGCISRYCDLGFLQRFSTE